MDNYKRENRIAEALELRGWKAVELCEKTGISKSSLSHWIKQEWQPKQKPLMAMAMALDVSELWLAGYDVPMERAPEQKKADELAQLTNQLRKNDRLKRLFAYMCKLNQDQLGIIENMVKELNKVNSQQADS